MEAAELPATATEAERGRPGPGTSCLQPGLLPKASKHGNCCPSEYGNWDIFTELQNIFTAHSRLSTTMQLGEL